MNAILVLNVGDVMTENARHSMVAAARRWGCDYVETTVNRHARFDPTYSKCAAIRDVSHYERIAYYDADFLIHDRAPSVFESLWNTGLFYAVKDITGPAPHLPKNSWPTIGHDVRGMYYSPLVNLTGIRIPKEKYMKRFFNAGFFLMTPSKHGEILDYFEKNRPKNQDHSQRLNGHWEQALFNYGVQTLFPKRLALVDKTWNTIDPDVSENKMSSYAYHFTGISKGETRKVLPHFDWRA